MTESPKLVLHPDVEILPIASLREEFRSKLPAEEAGDWVVSRSKSRSSASVISSETAELLRRFSEPRTLTVALLEHCESGERDAGDLLHQSRNELLKLLRRRIVIPVEVAESDGTQVLRRGDEIGGWRELRPLSLMEDSEVHLVRSGSELAVLKIRRGTVSEDHQIVAHEAKIMQLFGKPKLREVGEFRGMPYLVTDWFGGVAASTAAVPLRCHQSQRESLRDLLAEVCDAYAALHREGLVHGDVHPNNVLVDRRSQVCLIDFGLARHRGQETSPLAGGVTFFFAPEIAQALLKGRSFVPNHCSETYSIGALVYLLATGHHWCDFDLDRRKALRQIVESQPLSFEAVGVPAWPELESVLGRSLDKNQATRIPDCATLASKIRAVRVPENVGADRESQLTRKSKELLELAERDGQWWRQDLPGPTASLYFGAAGIAYALYRCSVARDDASLLAAADAWVRRAIANSSEPEAFRDAQMELSKRRVGDRSPYHCESGVWAVQALIASTLGADKQLIEASEQFIGLLEGPAIGFDLTLGEASGLNSLALLIDRISNPESSLRGDLIKRGDSCLDELWKSLTGSAPILLSDDEFLGMAHGWTGILYATLQWHRATKTTPPDCVRLRIEEVASAAEPSGRGLKWPMRLAGMEGVYENSQSGWCHGSAGYVFLWSLAGRVFREPRFLELCEGAAWDAFDSRSHSGSLCCGLIGRAYAMLELYQLTASSVWLRRAETLAERAAVEGRFGEVERHSLFKGELALAVLAADLERPLDAVFPFFEDEGW